MGGLVLEHAISFLSRYGRGPAVKFAKKVHCKFENSNCENRRNSRTIIYSSHWAVEFYMLAALFRSRSCFPITITFGQGRRFYIIIIFIHSFTERRKECTSLRKYSRITAWKDRTESSRWQLIYWQGTIGVCDMNLIAAWLRTCRWICLRRDKNY